MCWPGSGGEDMGGYNRSKSIVNTLPAGSFTNQSCYVLPHAVYEGTGSITFDSFEEETISDSESGVE